MDCPEITTAKVLLLPKISLHDHLDGSLRAKTIVDIARSEGVNLPHTDPTLLGEWITRQANQRDLAAYLQTFHVTLSVMQTAPALRRIAREYVLDLAKEHVVYGEVRWAPQQHTSQGLSTDTAVISVSQGISEGEAIVRAEGRSIKVRQIICAIRQQRGSLEAIRIALDHRSNGVVGADLAGAEAGHPASLHSDAWQLAAQEFLPVTIHAGEGAGIASIRSALVDGRAIRIGHGTRLVQDMKADGRAFQLGQVSRWIRDRGIVLELSPTSNLQTGAVDGTLPGPADHPFDCLYRAGFEVTVNTDNRLISGVTLSSELQNLAEAFGYTMHDLRKFQQTAALASFIGYHERDEIIQSLS